MDYYVKKSINIEFSEQEACALMQFLDEIAFDDEQVLAAFRKGGYINPKELTEIINRIGKMLTEMNLGWRPEGI